MSDTPTGGCLTLRDHRVTLMARSACLDATLTPRTHAGAFRMSGEATVDLDAHDITSPTGHYLLAYDCGCTVEIRSGWVVQVSQCSELHATIVGGDHG